jgi:type VI secretion system secreted protein VgrG
MHAELTFADEHVLLTVRAFSIRDGLSEPFDAYVTAASPSPDLDLANIVGRPAALRLHTGIDDASITASSSVGQAHPYAVWSGVCSHVEQIAVEENGESLYTVRIVPLLWRTTQRRNFRIFQHGSAVDHVAALLGEWGIDVALRMAAHELPIHEYRVQYGETDFAFASRMLEEAGVSYLLEQTSPRGAERQTEEERARERRLPTLQLVLTDRPGETGRRRERPIAYIGNTDEVQNTPWISKVRVGRAVRAGRFTIAGYDYRSSPDLRLLAEARAGFALEERYELFHYQPGAFVGEPPVAAGSDARTRSARVDETLGARAARLGLERERTRQQSIAFVTNQLDLTPGTIFRMLGHPRAELGGETGILVTARRIEGHADGEWSILAEAIAATEPLRPQLSVHKPRVMGLESAIVVGPAGEDIYTDALGRVRVQFHWDRYGQRDEGSSCWIRVSQGWAGSGYGTSYIPRVGHEVLVDFFEGDPDEPLVVGRAYNRGALPPDELPKKKTKSTWRSASSPGSDGFSEISIDDAAGEELLYLRAQKDMRRIVLADDEAAVGGKLTTTVRKDEERKVGGNQRIEVKGDRDVSVAGSSSTRASSGMTSQSGDATGVSIADGKVILTNGTASIVLDGPHVYIDAQANLRLSAGRSASLYGKQVNVDGMPDVFLNCGEYVPPSPASLPGAIRGEGRPAREEGAERPAGGRPGRGRPERPGGVEEARFSGKDYLVGVVNRAFGTSMKLPKQVRLPRELDEQLERYGRLGHRGEKVAGKLLDADTYKEMRDRFNAAAEREKARLQKLGDDVHRTFEKHRDHYDVVGKRLGERLTAERAELGKARGELKAIFSGERGNLIESAKALADVAREQAKNLQELRKDITEMVDQEMAYFERVKAEWSDVYDEVKGYAEEVKQLVDDPKDALVEMVFGEDKELANDLAGIADSFGAGDDVRGFLGLDPPGGSAGGGTGGGSLGGGTGGSSHVPPAHPPPDGRGLNVHRTRANPGRMRHMDQPGQAGARPGRLGNLQPGGGSQEKMSSFHRAPPQAATGNGAGHGAPGMASVSRDKHGVPVAASGASSHAPGYGGEALSRQGGLGAGDYASTVKPDAPSFLQSPSDGTLMVVPEQGARPVDAGGLKTAMVDAQMAGQPASAGVAGQLSQQGYTVYSRPYGDWYGPFVQTAEATAAKA